MTLKQIRESKNWSLETACKAFCIDAETLINYETGKEVPDMSILNTILNVLELDYDDIIFDSNCFRNENLKN